MLLRRTLHTTSASAAMFVAVLGTRSAYASNPLEYPDIGAASFGRGGAWVATASDPLAVHFNPATLPTQASGFSLDLNMPYNDVCYVRTNPGDAPTGPTQGSIPTLDPNTSITYKRVCNEKTAAPRLIPALAVMARLSDRLGIGFAVVPPNAYGGGPGEWPSIATARFGNRDVQAPASYRFMTAGNKSTILHPTLSAGYEVASGFRVGAGFIWSIGVIDVESFGMSSVQLDGVGDDAVKDSRSRLKTTDGFVPGAVLGVHWSATKNLDFGLWGRWLDAIDTSKGDVTLISQYYNGAPNIDFSQPNPLCTIREKALCQNQGVINTYGDDDDPEAFEHFRFVATPPEVRIGVRWHVPRSNALAPPQPGSLAVRDPLAQDLYDVELDGSWSKNSDADLIEIRFKGKDGRGLYPVPPTNVNLPPRADRPTGYQDSFGVRLGGQWNAVQNVFGVRLGTWLETKAVEDDGWLNVNPVPGMRGGYGGGVVFRHGTLDVSLGYQRHWNQGLDNKGDGLLRGGAGVVANPPPEFNTNDSCPVTTATCVTSDEDFRTPQTVNGGRVSQSANVINVGAVFRF